TFTIHPTDGGRTRPGEPGRVTARSGLAKRRTLMADPTSAGSSLPAPDPSYGADMYFEFDTGFSRYCFFFPLNGTSLLPEHEGAIHTLADELNEGKYYELYALADRSGSQEVNYRVSHGRYNAVMMGLWENGYDYDPNRFFEGKEKILGEDFYEYMYKTTGNAKYEDGKQTAVYRAVVVYVWKDEEASKTEHAEMPILVYGRSVTQPPV